MCNSFYDISNDIVTNFLGFGERRYYNNMLYTSNYFDTRNVLLNDYDVSYNKDNDDKAYTKITHYYSNFSDVIKYNEINLNLSFSDISEI